MLWWVSAAFIFGFIIPYMARRFAKFMPATLAGALRELLRREKRHKNYRKSKLYKKFFWRSVVFGFINGALTAAAWGYFANPEMIIVYMWLLFLLAEIDKRMFVLPDILTIPLLLLGLTAAYIGVGEIAIDDSLFGALAGYFLPVAVSLLIVWYKKDAFGGGDIKLLMAIGSWLGVIGLLLVITGASILGLITALIQRKKSIAFGPMLAIAGILAAFII